jgi:hypothetical protein
MEDPVKHFVMFKSRALALVASATVLALAAAGGAVAGSKITSADIQDHAVKKVDLHKNSVVSNKVKNGKLKMKDLDKPTQDAIKKGVGPAGPAGPAGPQGPAGPPGGAGSSGAPTETGVASVYVDRGSGPRTRFAVVSAALGPMATTTSGHFRFSCSAAQAPCEVSLGAAVISPEGGTSKVYPRLTLHKESGAAAAPAPLTFCEYADGANNGAGFADVSKVATAAEAVEAMRSQRVSMGVGGSLDCGAGQTSTSGTVTELLVPAGSATAPAYYDVLMTFAFQ